MNPDEGIETNLFSHRADRAPRSKSMNPDENAVKVKRQFCGSGREAARRTHNAGRMRGSDSG